MKKDENLSTLIHCHAALEADLFTPVLCVRVRQNGQNMKSNVCGQGHGFGCSYKMRNGDVVTAELTLTASSTSFEIRGAVYRRGIYELNAACESSGELVNEPGALPVMRS